MAIGGMCSKESGIENSRMFIGVPPVFVRPRGDGFGYMAASSPFAASSTGGRSSTRSCVREAQGRHCTANVNDHARRPDSAQGLSAVDSDALQGRAAVTMP